MKRGTTWESRCRSIILPVKPFRGNDDTKYGKEHEPIAMRLFREESRTHTVEANFGFCIHYHMPIFGYSPDGIMDNEILLEVKCLAVGKILAGTSLCEQLTKKPKYLEKHGSVYTLRKSTAFYTQIQFGLAVLNLEMANLLLYFKSTEEGVVAINVPRDEAFIVELVSDLQNIYCSYILPFLLANERDLLISKAH